MDGGGGDGGHFSRASYTTSEDLIVSSKALRSMNGSFTLPLQ